jgi:hypothetical protein
MECLRSVLLVFSTNAEFVAAVKNPLQDFDWIIRDFDHISEIAGDFLSDPVAAILIDSQSFDAQSAVEAVRRLPAPANGTPILISGSDTVSVQGANGRFELAPPQLFLAALEQWVGPLNDHIFRAEPQSPRYRMIRLMGGDATDSLFGSFKDALKAALDGPRDGQTAHKIAGLAGMMGYHELSIAWKSAEAGNAEIWLKAANLSRSLLKQL